MSCNNSTLNGTAFRLVYEDGSESKKTLYKNDVDELLKEGSYKSIEEFNNDGLWKIKPLVYVSIEEYEKSMIEEGGIGTLIMNDGLMTHLEEGGYLDIAEQTDKKVKEKLSEEEEILSKIWNEVLPDSFKDEDVEVVDDLCFYWSDGTEKTRCEILKQILDMLEVHKLGVVHSLKREGEIYKEKCEVKEKLKELFRFLRPDDMTITVSDKNNVLEMIDCCGMMGQNLIERCKVKEEVKRLKEQAIKQKQEYEELLCERRNDIKKTLEIAEQNVNLIKEKEKLKDKLRESINKHIETAKEVVKLQEYKDKQEQYEREDVFFHIRQDDITMRDEDEGEEKQPEDKWAKFGRYLEGYGGSYLETDRVLMNLQECWHKFCELEDDPMCELWI